MFPNCGRFRLRHGFLKMKEIKMPVHKVKGGYKFGKSGKLYRGKSAKKKAQKQVRAIYASGYREKI